MVIWKKTLFILFFVFFTILPRVVCASELAENLPWEWDKDDLRKIEKIEKKLDEDDNGYWTYEDKDVLVKCNINPRFTAELALYMEYFFDVFPKVFEVPPAGKMLSKLHVYVHKTRSQYMAATGAPAWSGGVHIPKMYGAGWPVLELHGFPWGDSKEPDFCKDFNRGVMQHEGTHALFQRFAGKSRIPVFFNEGCATYFESWNLRVRKPTEEERSERFKRGFHLKELVRKMEEYPGYKPNLSQCLNMDHGQWGSGEIGLHYALAESFVDFLLSYKKGRRIFEDMVEETYKRVAMRVGTKPLLDKDDIEDLEPQWHEHIAMLVKTIKANEKTAPSKETAANAKSSDTENAETKTDGQENPAKPVGITANDVSKEEFEKALTRKITFEIEGLPFEQAVQVLTFISNVRFRLGEGADGAKPVTVKVADTPVKAVVPKMMEQTGTKCVMQDGVLTFVKK